MDRARRSVSKVIRCERQWFREFLAEMMGTMFLVCLGDGAVAQVVLSRQASGTFLTVNLAYAFAIAFGIYISGGVSGGHINPAITLAMCTLGKTPWRKLGVYWAGQTVGAFLGALLVYGAYKDAIDHFDEGIRYVYGSNGTAGIFATYPSEFASMGTCLYDQILGTAILAVCVLALTDQRNMEVPKHLVPLLIGLTVGVIGMSYGLNCGYAINPARDFAPRLFTFLAGWGTEVFSFNDYTWFWIPVIAPMIGAVLGALVYELSIGIHWPASDYDMGFNPQSVGPRLSADSDSNFVKATKLSAYHPAGNEPETPKNGA